MVQNQIDAPRGFDDNNSLRAWVLQVGWIIMYENEIMNWGGCMKGSWEGVLFYFQAVFYLSLSSFLSLIFSSSSSIFLAIWSGSRSSCSYAAHSLEINETIIILIYMILLIFLFRKFQNDYTISSVCTLLSIVYT